MSLITTIMDVVETRAAICTVDNGYNFDVLSVERPLRGQMVPAEHLQVVITRDDPEQDDEISYAGNPNAVGWVLPVRVACIVLPDEDDQTPIDELAADFAIDVSKAIMSIDPWWTFGGNAINCAAPPIVDINPGDGTSWGCQLVFRILYRTEETDPNTAA